MFPFPYHQLRYLVAPSALQFLASREFEQAQRRGISFPSHRLHFGMSDQAYAYSRDIY
jgi:hypothetical protein